METFREEHYEVEANKGTWQNPNHKTWQKVLGPFQSMEECRIHSPDDGPSYRIIRCTTVREVVES